MSTHQLPEHPDFLWHNPEPKSSYDAVLLSDNGQVKEVRFSGQKRVFVFNE